jgi:hypothetical protein
VGLKLYEVDFVLGVAEEAPALGFGFVAVAGGLVDVPRAADAFVEDGTPLRKVRSVPWAGEFLVM